MYLPGFPICVVFLNSKSPGSSAASLRATIELTIARFHENRNIGQTEGELKPRRMTGKRDPTGEEGEQSMKISLTVRDVLRYSR